jgi:hypothetical protein
MKIEKNAPALPCMPMQDSLGRFFSPISGFTKYEYAVLMLITPMMQRTGESDRFFPDDYMIQRAREIADEFFKQLNDLEDEKNNITTIIQ